MTFTSNLLEKGYAPDKVRSLQDSLRTHLLQQGYPQDKIDKLMGVPPVNEEPIKKWYQGVFSTEITKRIEKAQSKEKTTTGKILEGAKAQVTGSTEEFFGKDGDPSNIDFSQALLAGFQSSATGMLARGKLPDIPIPTDAPTIDQVTYNVAQIASDLPFMTAGFLSGGAIGTPAGPAGTVVGSGVGAGALPAGLRQWLIDEYSQGSLDNSLTAWDRIINVLEVAGKEGLIFGATAGVGFGVKAVGEKVALPSVTRPIAEVGTMVTVSKALEGQTPDLEDFLIAGATVGTMAMLGRGVTKVSEKTNISKKFSDNLKQIYYKTGRNPQDVMKDTGSDVLLREDLMGSRDTPRSYPIAPDVPPDTPGLKPLTKEPKVLDKEELLEGISVGEFQKTKGFELDDFYTKAFDQFHPIAKFMDKIAKGQKIDPEFDPYVSARLMPGVYGKVEHFLRDGTFTSQNADRFAPDFRLGKSLDEILLPVRKGKDLNFDELKSYLTHKRSIEVANQGLTTRHSKEKSTKIVNALDAKYNQVAKEIVQFNRDVLDYIVNSGLVSKDQANLFKRMGEDYVPLHRVVDQEKGFKTGGSLMAFSPIKAQKGSERDIIDPIESIVRDLYVKVIAAERNTISKNLVEFAKKFDTEGTLVSKSNSKLRPVKLSEAEMKTMAKEYGVTDQKSLENALTIFRPEQIGLKPNEIVVFEQGKPQIYNIDKDLATVFRNMDTEVSGFIVTSILAPTNKLFKAGTTLTPEFLARNLVRDPLTAAIYSKNGYRLGIDSVSGLWSILGRDAAYKEWLRSGGANASFVSLDRKYIQEEMGRLITERPVINQITNPVQWLRVINEMAENSTRVGEFKRARAKGKGPKEAAFDAREVTQDFARMGRSAAIKGMNQVAPFFNPTIQGTDKLLREFSQRPKETIPKALAMITVPSLLIHLGNHYDHETGELEDWYANRPQWEKDLYWVIRTKKGETPAEDVIVKVPKPFSIGLMFGTFMEGAADASYRGDPKALQEALKSLGADSLPAVMPTVVKPFMQAYANKNFFTDAPLIPAGLENQLSQYQYKPYTTEAAKALSKTINEFIPIAEESPYTTPVFIEQLVRDWSGGLGFQALGILDASLRKAGVLPDIPKPEDTLSDIPVVKAFIARNPTSGQFVSDFYKKIGKAQKIVNSAKAQALEGKFDEASVLLTRKEASAARLNTLKQSISKISQAIRMITANPEMESIEKRQLIDGYYTQMNLMAKQGLDVIKEIEEIKP